MTDFKEIFETAMKNITLEVSEKVNASRFYISKLEEELTKMRKLQVEIDEHVKYSIAACDTSYNALTKSIDNVETILTKINHLAGFSMRQFLSDMERVFYVFDRLNGINPEDIDKLLRLVEILKDKR